jgi:adenine-specific DNA-methyltransferase
MAQSKKDARREIAHYAHADKERLNNPPVGLVTPDTDRDTGKETYAYDPHLDPQLVWAGKAEHTSFEVPTVSLHVHERIDPRTIIEAIKRPNDSGTQLSLFASPKENPPIRQAIEFYKHKHNWSNRLIAGDSLLVMNSLLEKEGMAGQVQMVYIDPPYGISYRSNFQPFVNKRDVKDGKDEDLTQEPEMIKAFRDTWELGIHSYLAYLRNRLLLCRELLHESGSIFVQISDENLHRVRCLMDEVFGAENAMPQIVFRKTTGAGSPSGYVESIPQTCDYLLWYARERAHIKFNRLFMPRGVSEDQNLRWLELPNGERRRMKPEEVASPDLIPKAARPFRPNPLTSQSGAETTTLPINFEGKVFRPGKGGWKTNREGMDRLIATRRLIVLGSTLCFVRYLDDFPYRPVIDIWDDTRVSGFGEQKIFVVQTNPRVVARCLLMTTDPGDLVFDPTCGSATTAYVSERWGRRWITCDTSRVSITLAKQRLMTATFDYYELAHPGEGVGSGFRYKTVPHVTLKSIVNNEPPTPEILYDHPLVDSSKARVSGPFTIEAVPAPAVKPLMEIEQEPPADESIARIGETQRQGDWRDELFKTGIRGKGGQRIAFSRVEPLPGTRWLHADAETKEDTPQRVMVSFGPEHAPLEQRQVELAIEEAQQLVPKPKIIVFAAFQFDPEAAKDIDETHWPGVTLLKAQMNADLLTEDLKKKRASNESFWLIGQPDIEIEKITKGEDKGKYRISVQGFDYYNTKTGTIESGGADKIAMWLLDPDYDGRSLFPRQVFFIADVMQDGIEKLARNLKAEIDPEKIAAYCGMVSLPFAAGVHCRAAVTIIDDRGIESLKVIGLD